MAENIRFLDLILRPSRSLSSNGFLWLMTAIGLISMAMGIFFLSIGAWPVFGFFGLDITLLYIAFRMNFRDGNVREHVVLDSQNLSITRSGPKEEQCTHHFQPAWVRVEVKKRRAQATQLCLRSHGQSLIIGDFLPPQEIAQVAKIIDDALARHQSHRGNAS